MSAMRERFLSGLVTVTDSTGGAELAPPRQRVAGSDVVQRQADSGVLAEEVTRASSALLVAASQRHQGDGPA